MLRREKRRHRYWMTWTFSQSKCGSNLYLNLNLNLNWKLEETHQNISHIYQTWAWLFMVTHQHLIFMKKDLVKIQNILKLKHNILSMYSIYLSHKRWQNFINHHKICHKKDLVEIHPSPSARGKVFNFLS